MGRDAVLSILVERGERVPPSFISNDLIWCGKAYRGKETEMHEKCFRCGKRLPDSFTVTIGGPPGLIADDLAWHYVNAAPHAASGGTMVPVCNICDPPPVFISRAQYEALMVENAELKKRLDQLTR